MLDKKVSETAIWEGSIPTDSNTPAVAPQMQTQPQMTFCYKCNNVIPADSKFCPCCNVELYTTCPKCGIKYSSKYSICNQCGTNREEYLQIQRREAERKEAIERENKRRQEIEERKRLEQERKRKEAEEEKERQEELRRWRAQESVRREHEFIKETDEFKCAYDYLCELNQRKEEHNKKQRNITIKRLAVIGVIWILGTFCLNHLPDFIGLVIMTAPLWCWFLLIFDKSIHNIATLKKYCPQTRNFNNKLTQTIIDIVSEYIATHNIDLNSIFPKKHFIEEIIKAYKNAKGSTVAPIQNNIK